MQCTIIVQNNINLGANITTKYSSSPRCRGAVLPASDEHCRCRTASPRRSRRAGAKRPPSLCFAHSPSTSGQPLPISLPLPRSLPSAVLCPSVYSALPCRAAGPRCRRRVPLRRSASLPFPSLPCSSSLYSALGPTSPVPWTAAGAWCPAPSPSPPPCLLYRSPSLPFYLSLSFFSRSLTAEWGMWEPTPAPGLSHGAATNQGARPRRLSQ